MNSIFPSQIRSEGRVAGAWIASAVLLLSLALQSHSAQAEERPDHDDSSEWTTSSHLAYAVHRSSSLGFAKVGGSSVLLDVARNLSQAWSAGIRTMGSGGRRSELAFYRLVSGPMLAYRPIAGWTLHASAGPFSESGLSSDGATVYHSRGQLALVGWQRSEKILPRVELAWGTFMTWHSGVLDTRASSSGLKGLAAKRNAGVTQGVEVALTISM